MTPEGKLMPQEGGRVPVNKLSVISLGSCAVGDISRSTRLVYQHCYRRPCLERRMYATARRPHRRLRKPDTLQVLAGPQPPLLASG